MSSTARPRFLWKATSLTPRALAVVSSSGSRRSSRNTRLPRLTIAHVGLAGRHAMQPASRQPSGRAGKRLAARTGKETEMTRLTRRSLLHSSLSLVAAGALARPYIANAQAKTAEVWWAQGFAQEEDVSIKKIVADYEKASGNKIDLQITPFAPQRQKIISAVTSGVVPDLFPNNPAEIIALFAWEDKLLDLTDVVATQREEYTETALTNTFCYNNVTKKRSFYGVPFTTAALPNHVWRSLVEKAGYKMDDIPKTWDAYYD